MQIFFETFSAMSPLYFFMLAGVLLRKSRVITDALLHPLNRLVFMAFLPVSLFLNIYDAQLDLAESLGAIGFALISFVVLFVALMLIVPRLIKERPAAATVVQGLYRSNFVLLGLAYVAQLYGKENIGAVSILIAVIIPLFNILAVVDFAILSGEKVTFGATIMGILKNPLIVASVLALALRLINVQLPKILYLPLDTISGIATPFAMIVVGASLTLQGFQKNGKLVAMVTAARLIFIPAVFVSLAVLFGFRGITLIALFTAFAGPCAVSSSAMAYQMGGDGDLAGQLVATTTVLSLPTMYLFIVLLRTLGVY
ncbi:MAG: AEC family transporter [Clostridiales bacterium]|nr:AEC family transporter [Clostridiales bacterium]